MNFSRWQNNFRSLALVLLVVFFFAATPGFAATNAVEKFSSADCLDCHTDPKNTRIVKGEKVALALFPTNGFKKSVQSALDCIDCHDGIKGLGHNKMVPPSNCASCNEKEGHDYAGSIHGMSHKMGGSGVIFALFFVTACAIRRRNIFVMH